jgi:hypothetical protein
MQYPKSNPLILSLSLAAALLVAACDSGSGGDPAIPEGSGIADCDALLTSAEAAEILGMPIVEVVERDSLRIMGCTYQGGSLGQLLPPQIMVTAFTTARYAASFHTTVPAYYDALDARTAASLKTPLTGVGTKAMWMNGPAKVAMYKGDLYADIFCRPNGIPIRDTSAAAQAGAKAAALKIAARN